MSISEIFEVPDVTIFAVAPSIVFEPNVTSSPFVRISLFEFKYNSAYLLVPATFGPTTFFT